jgi:hypothetical protein
LDQIRRRACVRTIPGVNIGLHAGSSCWVNLESAAHMHQRETPFSRRNMAAHMNTTDNLEGRMTATAKLKEQCGGGGQQLGAYVHLGFLDRREAKESLSELICASNQTGGDQSMHEHDPIQGHTHIASLNPDRTQLLQLPAGRR